ncbi:MAG: CarD family transcriptional regulator [Halocynthiibacter sp.]
MATRKSRAGFKTGEFVVYPAHGVGKVVDIETQEIAGTKLELIVIEFEKDKMMLRVPVAKANAIGMRKLSEPDMIEKALKVVRGNPRIKRTMWSRRAQEYEAKINSGDLISVAEVVRDLYRDGSQPEQSYSERQLFEVALERLAREIASARKVDEAVAVEDIEAELAKGAGRRARNAENQKAAEESEKAAEESSKAAEESDKAADAA